MKEHLGVIIMVAVIVVIVAIVALLIIRRQRYKRALKSRGWWFDSKPALETVLDHQAPPFGLGFERKVDEGVAGGTRAGLPFRVFEYACNEGGPKFDQRMASVQLPLALPDLFVSSTGVRNGVRLPAVDIDPRLQVRAADPAYARAVLSSSVLNAIALFGQAGYPVDLSIDGRQLVSVGAPKQPAELEVYLEALAPIAQAIDPGLLSGVRRNAAYAGVRLLRPPGLGLRRPGRQPDQRVRADHRGLRPLDREGHPGHQRRPAVGRLHPPLEDAAERELHRREREHPDPDGDRAALRDRLRGEHALRLPVDLGRRRLGREAGQVRERGVQPTDSRSRRTARSSPTT